jgi:hypothetical protein
MPALWRSLAALLLVGAGVFSLAAPASFAAASARPDRVIALDCPGSTNWDIATQSCV